MSFNRIFFSTICVASLLIPSAQAQSEPKKQESLLSGNYFPSAFLVGSALIGSLLYYGFFKSHYNALDQQINEYSQQIAKLTTATDSLEQLIDLCEKSSHYLWFARKKIYDAKTLSILTHGALSFGASLCSCALLENHLSPTTDEATGERNK